MLEIIVFVAVLFALMFSGVPIGFALCLVGGAGFALHTGVMPAIAMLGQTAADTVLDYGFSVLPMFLLMGNIIARSRIAEELYDAATAFIGHWRGGLAAATVVACGGFSAVCGSSVATAATMARISIPMMQRRGYDKSLAVGSVAAGGTLGILIPPSVAFMIYGLITETDIGDLFIAGIIPGILGVALYVAAIVVTVRARPEAGPSAERRGWAARLRSLRGLWAVGILFIIVMGGIYSGLMTATEAAAVGAGGACLIALARRDMTRRDFIEVFAETGVVTASLFVVVIGALILTNYLNVAGLADLLKQAVLAISDNPTVILLMMMLVYLILGCFLDAMAIMLLTVPIFFPIALQLGFDPVWFGVLVVIAIEFGLISPPFGINLFVARVFVPDLTTQAMYRGVIPFLVSDIVRLGLIIAVPALALFLPQSMK